MERLKKLGHILFPFSPERGPSGVPATHQNDLEQQQDAEARLRARQLITLTRLTPLNALANLLDVGLTIAILENSRWQTLLYAWAALHFLLWGAALHSWRKMTTRTRPLERVSQRAIRQSSTNAAILALMWSIPPALMPVSNPEQQLFITAITSGMICAGAFALYTVPIAALTFISILGSASILALLVSELQQSLLLILLLLVYLLIIAISVVHAAAVFRAHVLAEIASEQQSQVISLLLNDFEQSTADVLWESDNQLQLRRVNDRLAGLFNESKEELEQCSLLSLFRIYQQGLPDELHEKARLQLQALNEAMASDRAFRDQELPLQINLQTRWWSITAKPAADGGWRGVIADITASHLANQKIWQLAHQDSVTGLANRHCFQTELETLLRGCRYKTEQHALMSVDLDRFKAVNDSYGHDVGDLLLKVVAKRLTQGVRTGDMVARIGGDEFAIILRHTGSRRQVMEIGRRLVRSLHENYVLQGINVTIGASIGVAFIPDDGILPEIVIKHADLALYRAKAAGRGQIIEFDQVMADESRSRHRIEQALRHALETHQLYLAYQPQRHLHSGHLVGVEALARWKDPQLGQIPPALFVDIAEEAGLIHRMGKQVIDLACRQLASWNADITLSVNLSPMQLINTEFTEHLQATLQQYRVPPERLELEITENVLLDDSPDTLSRLQQIRAMGVRIALDDFGTGYSSLGYLRRFPFHKIKIDRAFVHNLPQDKVSVAIVGSIITMARALEMEVVAEGVENQDCLETLTALGCDMAQGYQIFPPMSAQDFGRLLVRPTSGIA